jgi:hypothetical protein
VPTHQVSVDPARRVVVKRFVQANRGEPVVRAAHSAGLTWLSWAVGETGRLAGQESYADPGA